MLFTVLGTCHLAEFVNAVVKIERRFFRREIGFLPDGISYVTISPRWAGLTAADFLQASMSVYTDDRICFKRTIGITKKSRTIPAHTYKESQKDKRKRVSPSNSQVG